MKKYLRYLREIVICLGLALLLVGFIATLDTYREIKKIGIGSIWHLPSRIYSSELLIKPGVDIEHIGLMERLARLRYREVSSVESTGEYSWDSDGLTIFIHPFEYIHGRRDACLVKLVIDKKKVREIISIDEAVYVDEAVVEPECLTEMFDELFEDRTIIALDDCPQYLLDAIITTEDKRFFEHSGIDIRSLVRATLTNVRHGEIVEGGSTITQQLIKNLFLTSRRTFARKAREMWMSLIMETVYSKREILGIYINEVYMGRWGHAGIYGLGRASRLFFDKDISELDLHEASLLAGIIRAPNRYSPYTNPGRAIARRNTVLELMLEENKISQDIFEQAKQKPLDVIALTSRTRYAPYFIDFILSQIQDQYPSAILTKGGYRIYTTLDMHMQIQAENLLRHGLKSRDARVEGAVFICDPASGDILTMVGGKRYADSQFNRSTQINRHIGSLIKPLIYYSALRRGNTLSTFIDDSPIAITLEDDTVWEPVNFDKQYHGRVMLKDALVQSYNLATVRLGMKIGVASVASEINRILPGHTINENPSLLLGALDCSPMEVAVLYSAYANGGRKVSPNGVRGIANENGTFLLKRGKDVAEDVLDPAVVYLINTALMEVVSSGTARASAMYGMPGGICGKTGTTNEMRDSWFAGFTQDVVLVVWLGDDDFQPIGLSGASGAMPIASMILSRIARPGTWPVPSDIVFLNIDPVNGKLARRWNRQAIKLPYVVGTQPTEVSEEGAPEIMKFFRKLFGD